MRSLIKETFSLFITDSVYVNTFQFLTLNYRLYSANFWYNQCDNNKYFFDSFKNDEYFPKLIDFSDPDTKMWNENFIKGLLDNKALVETFYKEQNPQVQIFDDNNNLINTTNFLDALENFLFGNLDISTLNKKSPYELPIKETKSAHDLTLIQIDIDGTYLNLTNDLDSLDEYINNLKSIQDKSIVIFNTQRVFFDTFDYMLYFLKKYNDGFYLCCDNGTSLYHFGFYKEHIIWSKIKNHGKNKMFLRAVKNNNEIYNIVFDDKEYFSESGYEDGKYQINDHWSISYYSNQICNKTDLVEEFLDEYYENRISNIINLDDNNNSSMFNIKLKKSKPIIINYTVLFDNKNKNGNLIYLENKNDWIKSIEYDL